MAKNLRAEHELQPGARRRERAFELADVLDRQPTGLPAGAWRIEVMPGPKQRAPRQALAELEELAAAHQARGVFLGPAGARQELIERHPMAAQAERVRP